MDPPFPALSCRDVPCCLPPAVLTEVTRALAVPATRARHVNVLQHLAGYFRGRLEGTGPHALGGTIADYQRGLVPLAVPTTLIAHHAQRFGMDYVLGQAYLQPHPRGLRARSDA